MLLASEAWVGVSRRLRTPPSTVVASGLRATRPKKNRSPEKKQDNVKAKIERVDENGE